MEHKPVVSLVGKVTWFQLLVGGDRYPMELVEVHASLSENHGYSEKIVVEFALVCFISRYA